MSSMSLVIAACLLIIPITISYKEHLELEKEIVISIVRAVVQLIIVGYILEFIFGLQNPIFTTGLLGVMIFNAAYNTKKRADGIKKAVWISFIALVISTGITLTILVFAGAIHFVPNEVIPVAGMVVSNSMVAIGLSYRNLNTSFKNRREEVEVKLSLGSDSALAAKEIIRDSIKLSIIPSIDSAKTLGIVSLPGMMTGLILAGASPLMAIKFQIMVTFMILSSASCAAMLATYLSYKHFFNERKQVKVNL